MHGEVSPFALSYARRLRLITSDGKIMDSWATRACNDCIADVKQEYIDLLNLIVPCIERATYIRSSNRTKIHTV
jgi:hypothetical protein